MSTPYRRCFYMDERGSQCEEWFPAVDDTKLCKMHQEIASPGSRNGETEENKIKYIDLVNDERKYCYHFADGASQHQTQDLIFQFKDDTDGTVFEKIDRHLAFLDKVIEDLKARRQTARAVRGEKMDALSEEQRKELRKIKIEKAVAAVEPKKTTIKSDPVGFLAKKGMSRQDAQALLTMDVDALLAKFEQAKKDKQ